MQHTNPKRPIVFVDGQYRPIATFTPKVSKNMKLQPPFQLQLSQNHYRPIIPWDQVAPEKRQRIEIALRNRAPPSNELSAAQLIKKFPKLSEARNRRFVAWDIEASQNVGEDESFCEGEGQESYAVGMAFYTDEFPDVPQTNATMAYDGEKCIAYLSFWGKGCLNRFIDFLNLNAMAFKDSTFFAHNAGKYDVPMLMREAFFKRDPKVGPIVMGEKCTCVNGKWISFQIQCVPSEAVINFRDSNALIMGPLDKLCKDTDAPI